MTEVFLLGALLIAFFALLVTDHQARQRDQELLKVVRRVDAVIYTLAANWGAPTEDMRLFLIAALNEQDKHRRKTD